MVEGILKTIQRNTKLFIKKKVYIKEKALLWLYEDCDKYIKLANLQENIIRQAVKVDYNIMDTILLKTSSFLVFLPSYF